MNRRDPRLTLKIFDEVDSLQTTQRTFCNLNVALYYLFHLYLFVSVASACTMLRILRSSSIKFLPRWCEENRLQLRIQQLCNLRLDPIIWDNTVRDDLSVTAPDELDCLRGTDTSATGITGWPKPMVLRGSRGAGSNSSVGRSIHCIGKDLGLEFHIV